MRPGDKAWTAADFQTMVDMRDDGASPAQIGKVLGRTASSVQSKLANRTSANRQAIIVPPTVRRCASRADYVTQTLMGDPPHQRSALYMKEKAECAK